MVKRLVWTNRYLKSEFVDETISAEGADESFRARVPDLPAGLPVEGWKRNVAWGVEVSAEKFAGSSPVWIWEE